MTEEMKKKIGYVMSVAPWTSLNLESSGMKGNEVRRRKKSKCEWNRE